MSAYSTTLLSIVLLLLSRNRLYNRLNLRYLQSLVNCLTNSLRKKISFATSRWSDFTIQRKHLATCLIISCFNLIALRKVDLFIATMTRSRMLLLLVLQMLSWSMTNPLRVVAAEAKSVKGGYWVGGTSTAHLNLNFETHVWYAFAGIDPTTYKCIPPAAADDGGQYKTFVATALASNPRVKTLLSIGGASSSESDFAAMVSKASRRKVFIDSSISLARSYGFHGLDLDWEFPQNQSEMNNMGLLFKEWREAAAVECKVSKKVELLLTAAVSYQSILLYTGDGNQTYPIEAINNYLDWVNVMNYDYHGSWECCNTGEHTALYDPTSNLNTNYGISNWLKAGLHRKKCALGLAYYGKTWTLVSLKNTSVGAPTSKAGDYLLYRDIVTFNKEAPKSTTLMDKATVSMISFKSNLTWVGYDNPSTIARKVKYANRRELLGYFAWALHHDDNQWSLAKAAFTAFTPSTHG